MCVVTRAACASGGAIAKRRMALLEGPGSPRRHGGKCCNQYEGAVREEVWNWEWSAGSG
jgi:hypothetical protein